MIIEGQEKHSRAVIFKTSTLFFTESSWIIIIQLSEAVTLLFIAEPESVAQVYEANNGTIYL